MKNPIETVGIVGLGAMGQFMAERMFDGCEVIAHDPNVHTEIVGAVRMVGIEAVAGADAVVLAVPASTLPEALDSIRRSRNFRPDETLIADICSVKLWPSRLFEGFLPNHSEVLLCHPLFGPQSARKTLRGHRVIVTESSGNKSVELINRWRKPGLKIVEMTADEHDQEIADILGVPFVFGRIANMLDMKDSMALQTPSRLAVRKLQGLDTMHSEDLFRTVMEFNPYAVATLTRIEKIARALRQQQTDRGVRLPIDVPSESSYLPQT